jgi:hypothetical protein
MKQGRWDVKFIMFPMKFIMVKKLSKDFRHLLAQRMRYRHWIFFVRMRFWDCRWY